MELTGHLKHRRTHTKAYGHHYIHECSPNTSSHITAHINPPTSTHTHKHAQELAAWEDAAYWAFQQGEGETAGYVHVEELIRWQLACGVSEHQAREVRACVCVYVCVCLYEGTPSTRGVCVSVCVCVRAVYVEALNCMYVCMCMRVHVCMAV